MKDGGTAKDVVSYVLDIATTVVLWKAMTILIAENIEKRKMTTALIKKFDAISFHKKEKKSQYS